MKTFNCLVCAALVVATAGALGATGTAENYQLASTYQHIGDQTTIGSVDVPITAEIRAWFTANGVDGSKLNDSLPLMDVPFKDSVDAVVNVTSSRDALTVLVESALKKSLVRGSVERASMKIGRNEWTLSIYGPEDHS